MAVATSTQWGEIFRGTFPGFAASDVLAKAPVTLATQADNQVVNIATVSQEPFGIVRDLAQAGQPVCVYDEPGNVIRVVAGATVAQRQDINISGATSFAHPLSGLTATLPLYGPVSAASGSIIHRIGVALEEANPGEAFALRVHPKQLGGLS